MNQKLKMLKYKNTNKIGSNQARNVFCSNNKLN